ncbi:hypothetical protein VTH82DRAFT_1394 [Thermothelomyces myriococcoides]
MPVSLPISAASTGTDLPSAAAAPPPPALDFKARLFRPFDLSTGRGKAVAATVGLRLVANIVHFFLAGLSGSPAWSLWYAADQLVVTYAVSFIADAAGERRIWGTKWTVGERFFDMFLGFCGVAHVLYIAFLIFCFVSFAIFFGVTGGSALTVVGAIIVPVGVLAAMPEAEEGGLSLP